jgi:hypothetical protein
MYRSLVKRIYMSTRKIIAGCWCFAPVILGNGVTEIREIAVQSHPQQILHDILS